MVEYYITACLREVELTRKQSLTWSDELNNALDPADQQQDWRKLHLRSLNRLRVLNYSLQCSLATLKEALEEGNVSFIKTFSEPLLMHLYTMLKDFGLRMSSPGWDPSKKDRMTQWSEWTVKLRERSAIHQACEIGFCLCWLSRCDLTLQFVISAGQVLLLESFMTLLNRTSYPAGYFADAASMREHSATLNLFRKYFPDQVGGLASTLIDIQWMIENEATNLEAHGPLTFELSGKYQYASEVDLIRELFLSLTSQSTASIQRLRRYEPFFAAFTALTPVETRGGGGPGGIDETTKLLDSLHFQRNGGAGAA